MKKKNVITFNPIRRIYYFNPIRRFYYASNICVLNYIFKYFEIHVLKTNTFRNEYFSPVANANVSHRIILFNTISIYSSGAYHSGTVGILF